MKTDTTFSAEVAVGPLPLVLVIDDDVSVRESLAAVIEAFGFRARTAINGAEGLEAIGIETPAAIITDLHMPEMDGFELLTALRIARSAIPVIVISGGASKGYDLLKAARHMGAAATFEKPFPVLELVDMVSALTTQNAKTNSAGNVIAFPSA